ncbi:MAG: PQQ-binding-like beta-propeller repeat protein [Gemmataceae bacterium]
MNARLYAAAFLAGATGLLAADWPQWRGPDRTGLSAETGLLKEWPKGGPALLWKATGLGGGYSTPSVVGTKLYVLGAKDLKAGGGKGKGKGGGGGASAAESVFCLDLAKQGAKLWSTEVGSTGRSYPGPRSTPTVDGDRLFAISSDGVLACLDASDGKLVWKKSLTADFGGKYGNWNYAESPLIDGDRLICTPGGTKSTMVCLNKRTGSVIWEGKVSGLKDGKMPGSTAGYSSALVSNVAGRKTYVQMIQGGVIGMDAQTGAMLWHYDNPASSGANISTPLLKGDSVFAASGYGNGGGRADVAKKGDGFEAKEKFFLANFQNHHGGMVLVNGHIYGTGGQSLMCVNFDTGKVEWTDRGVGKGSVTYADGMIYHRGEGGDVALVEATPAGYKEKGRFKQPDRSPAAAWPHPVVCGGKLYLRDWDALLCYDVKK